MKLVIDTNVLMAGLLKDSIFRIILFSPNFKFFIPEYALLEIKKYESELIKKSGYSEDELTTLMNLLLRNVKTIPKPRIKKFMKQAEGIMENIDIKDSSFIAAALSIEADGIWSYDSHFKKQNKVRIFDVKELIKRL